jgi:hypothetical protein
MNRNKPRTMPLPVRFDNPTMHRLGIAAKRLGSTRSGIIRFAVFQQLQAIGSGIIRLTDNQAMEVMKDASTF